MAFCGSASAAHRRTARGSCPSCVFWYVLPRCCLGIYALNHTGVSVDQESPELSPEQTRGPLSGVQVDLDHASDRTGESLEADENASETSSPYGVTLTKADTAWRKIGEYTDPQMYAEIIVFFRRPPIQRAQTRDQDVAPGRGTGLRGTNTKAISCVL